MTIYINGIMNDHYRLKAICNFTYRHLSEWFPKLPSYVGFVQRINKISHLFEDLVVSFMAKMPINMQENLPELINSMPIVLAHRGRQFTACVAQEIATNNGYCATKKLHYYGVKLHVMGQYETGSLPISVRLCLTNVRTGDIKILDDMEKDIPEGSKNA